jgi:thioredoxin 1
MQFSKAWHAPCVITNKASGSDENMNTNKANENEIGEANFGAEVLESKLPVVVAFLAPWSRPCQIIQPVLDEVAAACAGGARVLRVNADAHPTLGMWYEVQSIPTVFCFVNGKVRLRIVGTTSAEALLSKLRPLVGTNGEAPALSGDRQPPCEQDDKRKQNQP